MNAEIHTLDVVVLTEDIPKYDLRRGQVGTVVETLSTGIFEAEFIDSDGRTYATLPLQTRQLLVLHYQPV